MSRSADGRHCTYCGGGLHKLRPCSHPGTTTFLRGASSKFLRGTEEGTKGEPQKRQTAVRVEIYNSGATSRAAPASFLRGTGREPKRNSASDRQLRANGCAPCCSFTRPVIYTLSSAASKLLRRTEKGTSGEPLIRKTTSIEARKLRRAYVRARALFEGCTAEKKVRWIAKNPIESGSLRPTSSASESEALAVQGLFCWANA